MFNSPGGFNRGPVYVPPLSGSTIRAAVASLLGSVPAVAALAGRRISPGSRPQGEARPAVTYFVASRWESRKWSGATGIASARARISTWATTQAEAEELAIAIRARFVDFSGLVGAVRIEDCELANEIDLPERPPAGTDEDVSRVSLDLIIKYRV